VLAVLCVECSLVAGEGHQELLSRVESLYAHGDWAGVIELVPAPAEASGDLAYYCGLALAKLGRWSEAHDVLAAGQRRSPRDKRFPIELAGVAFKEQRFTEAERHLRRALQLDREDAYALNFLATLYLLDQNLDAAVELWNRIGKPRVEEVRAEPEPRLRPSLLDRAFAFAPADELRLRDLEASRARLDQLGVFPSYRFELEAHPGDDDRFDLTLRARELNGWGDTRLEGLLGLLGGLPYQTLYPKWWNLHRSAVNLTSLVRWDPNKRRLTLAFGSPLREDPKWHYDLYADARDENWDLTDTFRPAANLGFKLRKVEAGARVEHAVNGRWSWWTGASIARRGFGALRDEEPPFVRGTSLEYEGGFRHGLVSLPQHRLTLESIADGHLGHLFVPRAGVYSRAEGRLRLRWFPKARGDDYELAGNLSAGKTSGSVPFDQLFILGLERDNDLPLRAHIGTQAGKKGSAPLGPGFVLTNWEINKKVYEGAFFKLRLAPFFDSGRAYDQSGRFGSRLWLYDAGGQLKLRLFAGLNVVVTYGKDLRSGHNAYYATVEK
jgi:hypothetical protein